MIETKLIEIRDHATFIPAVAIACGVFPGQQNDAEYWLMRRAGYSDRMILLTRLDGGGRAEYDPFSWTNRTWHGAHRYLMEHWNEIQSGDVVDARVGLGEAQEPVLSERLQV